jgi:hypothetical protein
VTLREVAPGHWRWRAYDVELEPRFERWRVSQLTRHGVRDVACVNRLLDAQVAIAEDASS